MLCYCFMKLMYNNIMRHVYPVNIVIYMYIFHVGIIQDIQDSYIDFIFFFSSFFLYFDCISLDHESQEYVCIHLYTFKCRFYLDCSDRYYQSRTDLYARVLFYLDHFKDQLASTEEESLQVKIFFKYRKNGDRASEKTNVWTSN